LHPGFGNTLSLAGCSLEVIMTTERVHNLVTGGTRLLQGERVFLDVGTRASMPDVLTPASWSNTPGRG
jgi:hypothetical protein